MRSTGLRNDVNMDDVFDLNTEGGRGCRHKKKQTNPTFCPVCSVTLRDSELHTHLNMEVEKLTKLSCIKSRRSSPTLADSKKDDHEVYQKVKSNRQSRLKVKSKKRKIDEIMCPVCNKTTTDDITIHVEMCLQRLDGNRSDDDETIDVEGDDQQYEEYEWAGQMRIRTSTLLEGGFAGLGMGTSMSKSTEDEEIDVIVDGDDTHLYGSLQYTEQDVLKANDGTSEESETAPGKHDENQSKSIIIESLRLKIRELEEREQNKEQYKCLICMERYKTPVVSICCWHVHCEQCWLQTLSAKKLCPQCNMITSPTELRRIYM